MLHKKLNSKAFFNNLFELSGSASKFEKQNHISRKAREPRHYNRVYARSVGVFPPLAISVIFPKTGNISLKMLIYKMSLQKWISCIYLPVFLLIIAITACSATGRLVKPDAKSSRNGEPEWVTQLNYRQDFIEVVGYSMEKATPEISLKSADARAHGEMALVLEAADRQLAFWFYFQFFQ